jgi:uncharacterized protein YbjT (DUF2867 family)
MELKIIITGATGFVGEGVLLECLQHPQVKEVLVLNRKPYALQHPKLRECLVANLMELDAVKDQLKGYDACFYCVGISSAGLDEAAYSHITYDMTMNLARLLAELNPGMVFNFVSGRSTDSSEQGKVMWARVKGQTENALKLLPFKAGYNFRPGFMKPTPGQKNVKGFYKLLSGIWPLLFPRASSTMREVGLAMINVVIKGYPSQVLEVEDIKILAKG